MGFLRSRSTVSALLTLTIFLLLIAAALITPTWRTRPSPDVYRREGAELVEALAQYQRDEGVYPAMLEALVPKYREPLHRTLPEDWEYRPFRNQQGFELDFTHEAIIGVYHTRDRAWVELRNSE